MVLIHLTFKRPVPLTGLLLKEILELLDCQTSIVNVHRFQSGELLRRAGVRGTSADGL